MSKLREIAFSMIKGMTLSNAIALEEKIETVDNFFDSRKDALWQAIGAPKTYCTDGERAKLIDRARAELDFVEKNKVRALFHADDDFPRRLDYCEDAPSMLYALGDCDFNSSHVVAIVGTRRSTAYGNNFTARLVADLAERLDDLVIVSGLAYGIDVQSHKAALAAGVRTVGVVAHGLKTMYPADHRDIAARMIKNGGGVVTEYPSDAVIHRGNFLARNRIVAGMSDVVVIVESDAKGGAMVTASIASAYGREVCAVPGRATDRYSSGPNALIYERRATMIRNADDLIELMNWTARPKEGSQNELPFTTLDSVQQSIVDYVRKNPAATVNDMVAGLGMAYAELSAKIVGMEMDDVLTSLPGGTFQVNV